MSGNIFKRIWAFLTSPREPQPKHKHPDLYQLVDATIAKELQIRSEAARLGEAGLPAPDSIQLSGIEEQIVHRIERARLDYVDWANTRLLVLNEELSRLDITPVANQTLQLDQEFARKASALIDDQEPQIRALALAFQKRSSELSDFKSRNKLERDAHYPSGGKRFFKLSLFAFMILLEGGANAYFFAQGVDGGLVGGFIMAALFAGLNVISAGMQGRFTIPFIVHNNVALKIFGVMAVVTAICLMIGIGLGIAHYRDALSVDSLNPAEAAFASLKSAPFELQDIMSWLLFGISILFAIIALFDGLSLSDVYPFYATKTRRCLDAQVDYENALNELRAELAALKEHFLKQLNENARIVSRKVEQQEDVVQRKVTAAARLETAIHDAEHCLRSLLGTFRQENQIHRKSIPSPRTFNETPNLQSLSIPDFEVDSNWSQLGIQRRAADEVVHKLEDIKASIQAAFNREFDRLQPLGSHMNQYESDDAGKIT